MKIKKIEVSAVRAKLTAAHRVAFQEIKSSESCIVKIHTYDGIVGIGDSQRPQVPESVGYMIRELFAPLLIGRDPFDVQILWDEMYATLRNRGRVKGMTIEAMSAVDIALWDTMGKALGVPVYKLLGGKAHEKLHAYATAIMLGKPVEERLRDAQAYLDSGFDAFKVKAGEDVDGDISFMRQLRDRIGYDTKIMVDAGCALNFYRALKLGKALERYEVLWLEEPLSAEFVDDYVKLRGQVNVMLAAGESEFTVYGFKDWISRGALDVVQPDVGRTGGITQLKQISSMAEAFGLDFAPHCGHGSGVIYAATMHVATSAKNFLIFELEQLENPSREKPVKNRMDIPLKSYLQVHERSGIGVELDEGFVEQNTTMHLEVPACGT